MKLSLHATSIVAGLFAVLCLVAGINGLTSLGSIEDPARIADARGFAWFWIFLGAIGVAIGLVSSWMARTTREPHDEDDDGAR